ncbi:hotdog family protein [Vibrio rumoiensis]|uniref:3-hydroxydecanoyl-ACP dehydratase n=1 Tax=Vibrio rumoiensis 1S-45 TaxID=1188252 RepID=A0A1E5E1Z9_9VIBR|nr:hotdog family protein [Vibrio rumoiensis]OEF25443.1 3-hydroxydecanoyl-ACP dehydratase [Vibrio rumoiensis 1S-45]
MTDSTLPAIAELIPHEAPMILVDELIHVDDHSIHTQVVIQKEGLFFNQDKQHVPGYVGIEYMAQSIAAWSGFQAWQQGQPPSIGFLLGSRRYQSDCTHFEEHDILNIYAQKVMENNGMAVFQCTIEKQGQEVANAQLNAFVPSKEQLVAMLGKPSNA